MVASGLKLSAQISLSRGMREENIVITGHPGLDQYRYESDKKLNKSIRTQDIPLSIKASSTATTSYSSW